MATVQRGSPLPRRSVLDAPHRGAGPEPAGEKGAKPHDLKSGAAAMREGRSIVIPDRRAGNNAPALFFVAGFRAGGAHPPAPPPAPIPGDRCFLAGAGGGITF